MNDSQFAIRFEQVSKTFGEKRVLDRVSFEIERGLSFCILGRSGTGKSVTLKLIDGLIKPNEGTISVEGQTITNLDSRELVPIRKKMGFLFQSGALFDSITIGENVAYPLRRHTKKSEQEIKQRVREKLGLVGLENDVNKMPDELSGGMRKRAALARALALDPSILLVDEPSAGLDPITSRDIDDLLLSLKSRDTTLVVVTHNIPSARKIGDELAILHEGHIIARGRAQELEKSDNELVRELLQSTGGG